MTEQPAEPVTEQEWLQNQSIPVQATDPTDLDELKVRKAAQRTAPARLMPPTPLYPAPVVAMSRPYEVAQANVLLRKSITAAAKLLQARAVAKKAEDAMSEALATENLAEIDSVEADRALLDFVREVADQ